MKGYFLPQRIEWIRQNLLCRDVLTFHNSDCFFIVIYYENDTEKVNIYDYMKRRFIFQHRIKRGKKRPFYVNLIGDVFWITFYSRGAKRAYNTFGRLLLENLV